jgi:hypothetical protein
VKADSVSTKTVTVPVTSSAITGSRLLTLTAVSIDSKVSNKFDIHADNLNLLRPAKVTHR